MSGATSPVVHVDSSDVVDPADAALSELLARLAENAGDEDRREKLFDLMLTVPPIAQWPPEMLEEWRKTYDYVRGLRRQFERRQLQQMRRRRGTATPRE
jgi:hypothetical protein